MSLAPPVALEEAARARIRDPGPLSRSTIERAPENRTLAPAEWYFSLDYFANYFAETTGFAGAYLDCYR